MTELVTPRDLSLELKILQKAIRDYLCQTYGLLSTRDEVRWRLDAEQTAATRNYFPLR
ncbi:hypothetical protein [Paeniglutamicibacter gangotriensis]|uniref:hypothetical protein n=1 Tax=Paeniglutamicibacter gangotriensis TaxID=254787 RepID=UPI00165FF77D|nr:hypothetical protein [Paeniglutamicibacter gangotriensis]